MNHTADIRSVRPGDAPQLAHIQTESWKAAFREIIPAGILSEYTDPEPVTRMYIHHLRGEGLGALTDGGAVLGHAVYHAIVLLAAAHHHQHHYQCQHAGHHLFHVCYLQILIM